MKKSLLALAVLGAFAGTAAAQTNVTLYGIADAGIGFADRGGDDDSNLVHVFSGVQSTSRLGVRGSEDLGNGLRAVFNYETGVTIDNGGTSGSTFWQRRAVVGLAGGFGQVVLGRDYTPGFTAAGTTDVMSYGLWNNWLTYTANGGITTRASNGLFYTSPNWGGLTLRAMYSAGEADDEYDIVNGLRTRTQKKGTGDALGVSAVYANGPLTLQGYYQQFEGGLDDDLKQYGIGGQYAMGIFRLAVNYGRAEYMNIEHDGLGVGLGVKVGQGEFLANFIRQEVDAGSDPTADSFGIAYVHPLSKRTNIYASYGQLKNKDGANFVLRASDISIGGDTNSKPKAFAIGVRHMF